VELDELCISKRRNLWLWTAVSRYTGQILAFVIGDRKWSNLSRLWNRVPKAWQHRLVYTDGY
jgi:IS1 family transposase